MDIWHCDWINPSSSNRFVSSSENSLPEFVIPYMEFNNFKALPKYCAYSGKYSAYLMSNLTNTLFLTLACKNYPIKSSWWTLSLCFAVSARKYFKVLMKAVGDQVSPTISLFCKYPLTTILNFNLSRLPSDWTLDLYTSMHGVTGSPSFWSSIRKVWLFIRFFISLRVAFSQVFLIFSDNLLTSAKFLGSGMKWETSEVKNCQKILENLGWKLLSGRYRI